MIICKTISENQINIVQGQMRAALCTHRKKGQLLTNWFDVKERHSLSRNGKTLTVGLPITSPPRLQLQLPPTPNYVLNLHSNGPCMQLFRQHRCVFGFLFQFNRGEIGNIFFYSPLAPLESLLSFGLFMKNYFMLTYICCLFSPSVTCSKFSFISKALNPILYVCRSAFSIELRLKYRWTVRKVWQEETSDLLLCTGLYRRERKTWIPEKGETERWRQEKPGDF